MDKARIARYLERQYQNLSQDAQKQKLTETLERLRNINFLEPEVLEEVIKTLMDEEGWPIYKVIAHLDLVDLDQRT